jgi:predicted nucleic-acid-binding protein
MIMDFDQAEIDQLITHHVGNKQREENYVLNTKVAELTDETIEHLITYFLSAMKREEVYSFTHAVDWQQNDVFQIVETLFKDPTQLIEQSQNLAKLLYEASMHPKINEGELNL